MFYDQYEVEKFHCVQWHLQVSLETWVTDAREIIETVDTHALHTRLLQTVVCQNLTVRAFPTWKHQTLQSEIIYVTMKDSWTNRSDFMEK